MNSSRRRFLQTSMMGSAVVIGAPLLNVVRPGWLTARAKVISVNEFSELGGAPKPALAAFDHFQLGCPDLDAGIAWFEGLTGTRPGFGGVHPGRGTRNALASLGPRHYLEVYAPDPQQLNVNNDTVRRLRGLTAPTIIGWAIGTKDLEGLKREADAGGIKATVTPGSRQRPDGKLLRWRLLNLDAPPPLAPFFIEWSADSLHPSTDAPSTGTVERLVLEVSEPEKLLKTLHSFSIAAEVRQASAPRVRLTLATKKGRVEIG
jgi:Glyoxalase-like domain